MEDFIMPLKLHSQLSPKQHEKIKQELLSDEFIELAKEKKLPIETLMAYYRCVIMEIETKFFVLNEELSLEYDRNPIETIKTRLKSWDSLIKKMRSKNLPMTLESLEENISDVAGIRVICSFQEDIYRLAESFLRQDDVKLIEKKDYIINPKPNGYRSLHLIVEVPIFLQNETRLMKAEVQFRTIAMDFWASLEHKLRYKKNISDADAEMLADELLICSQMSAELDERMQTVKNKISAAEKK
ncbi:MAG: GTP pyrophosphokinase family protein [Ruminococcus sp.]|nr:GTP pyrophosphokinase family protein [Ruminococcus sp.]